MIVKELYKTTDGVLHLTPEELRELRNEDYNDYPDVVGHTCGACDEENTEDNMLEYIGMWWCKDCKPNLRRCDVCGTVYDTEVDSVCPECKA